MSLEIPEGWREVLKEEQIKPYWAKLESFVEEERATQKIFPPEDAVFNALKTTSYADVKVLLLGQDPYHDIGQAHGLSFSVLPGIKSPPSLVNIYKELKSDLGCTIPNNGYLITWATQGVLLLNAVLTVQAHTPNSHKDKGWEKFTDAIIQKLNERESPCVFLLWGAYAQKKTALITSPQHTILKMVHPSPLSAKNGFFGSKPFSQVNEALEKMGKTSIDWQIPNL